MARLRPPQWRAYPAAARIASLPDPLAAEAARLGARLIADDLAELGITVDCAAGAGSAGCRGRSGDRRPRLWQRSGAGRAARPRGVRRAARTAACCRSSSTYPAMAAPGSTATRLPRVEPAAPMLAHTRFRAVPRAGGDALGDDRAYRLHGDRRRPRRRRCRASVIDERHPRRDRLRRRADLGRSSRWARSPAGSPSALGARSPPAAISRCIATAYWPRWRRSPRPRRPLSPSARRRASRAARRCAGARGERLRPRERPRRASRAAGRRRRTAGARRIGMNATAEWAGMLREATHLGAAGHFRRDVSRGGARLCRASVRRRHRAGARAG